MTQARRRVGSDVKRLADLVQEAVDDGANTVEEIHKSIADLPLEVLERVDVFKETVRDVRRVQDTSIGAIYDVIRRVNREVTGLARDIVKATSKASTRARRSSAAAGRKKKTAARKATSRSRGAHARA